MRHRWPESQSCPTRSGHETVRMLKNAKALPPAEPDESDVPKQFLHVRSAAPSSTKQGTDAKLHSPNPFPGGSHNLFPRFVLPSKNFH
eukprot:880873-Amphidinium_carterae.4